MLSRPTLANVRPTSRGEMNLNPQIQDYPKIKMNYLSTDDDRDDCSKRTKNCKKNYVRNRNFKKYGPEEYRPGAHITDDEELVREAKYAQTIFHPVGTCKMGQDEMQ